jgi:hypothetical protein
LHQSKATRNLPAVRNRRFRVIPARLLTDTGPSIASSLTTLARILHPVLFVSQGQ